MLNYKTEIHPMFEGAPKTTEFKKLRKHILRQTRETILQYGIIEPGARWLVSLPGGKDSIPCSQCFMS
jgi:tRNA 2-thiocytidine biosynthesis protein TtcA